MTKLDDFKRELAALLEKYSAEIVFDVGESSDTYGLYADRLTVRFNDGQGQFKLHTLANGWTVDKFNLKN